MKICQTITRRRFCKTVLTMGAAVGGTSLLGGNPVVATQPDALPDLVAIRNGEPDVMFAQAIAAIGGLSRFIQPGQVVVVKPNIGWNRAPETGANTNPLLVQRVVEECFKVGAKQVYVFDNAVDAGPKTYRTSGLEAAAAAGGAIVVPGHTSDQYEEVEIPGGQYLKKARVHKTLIGADVLINVPVLKHHSGSQLTIAMKNLMGVVWDRQAYHRNNLHECIAEFCLYCKPTLNIVDAYRVTMANGPQAAREKDVQLMKMLLISPDIVAIDAAAAKIWGTEPERIRHIKSAYDKQLGNMYLDQLNIQRIVL